MKLLVVEDDEFKLKNVQRLLESDFPAIDVIFARSISSALQQLEAHEAIDVVVLDMSLPTFDVGPDESGGRPQGFGGLSVIQHLDALGSSASVLVLTQFLQFGEGDDSVDIDGLSELLQSDYPDQFKSLIHYGAGSDKWKADLTRALVGILERSH